MMRRKTRAFRWNVFLLSLSIGAMLFGFMAPPTGAIFVPSAQDRLQTAWALAAASGAYHYTSEVAQTTIPAPRLSSIGAPARTTTLFLDGEIDLPSETMQLALWQGDGNIATGQGRIELRIAEGKTFGRTAGEAWQEVPDVGGLFAPAGDPLAYLAAAKQVQADMPAAGDGSDGLPAGYSSYHFELDGPAFAEFMREQMEMLLREQGELPAGMSLGTSDAYFGMVGTGRFWVRADGLPARLVIEATFPPQPNGEQPRVQIKSDFSQFALLPATGLSPMSWAASLLPQTARQWTKATTTLSSGLLLVALTMLLVSARRSKQVYAAWAISTVVIMLVTPLFQGQQVLAFAEEQESLRVEQESQAKEQADAEAAVAQLATSTWDPHTPPNAQNPAAAPVPSVLEPSPAAYAGTSSASPNSNSGTDSDNDGLSNAREETLGSNSGASCGSDASCLTRARDTDNDTIDDGTEVLELGTDPTKDDTDGDGITDNSEVMGFVVGGQTWYSSPVEPDTNRDGVLDGLECAARVRANGTSLSPTGLCANTDGDGMPDIFDNDNDNDGVRDKLDTSPEWKLSSLSKERTFSYTLNQLQGNRDVLVDFQLRPEDANHLTYAMNVLDWPANDTVGQVVRKLDTTFVDNPNGDMRLIPLLEISMKGPQLPLPFTTPAITVALEATPTQAISGTVALRQVGDNIQVALGLRLTQPTATVMVREGLCRASNDPLIGQPTLISWSDVGPSDQRVWSSKKLLDVANATHALVIQTGSGNTAQTLCQSIPDLPNGGHATQMVDMAPLQAYGITLRDVDTNGTVHAYLPLNLVTGQGGDRQAFNGRMFYHLPVGATWGSVHNARLIWMVQLLGDDGTTQTIKTYDDTFALTGFEVREDHGQRVSVFLEDPATNPEPDFDEALWTVARGLQVEWMGAKRTGAGGTSLALDGVPGRLGTWGIGANQVQVRTYTFTNRDGLASFPAGENTRLLRTFFENGDGTPKAAAPTLLYAREETARTLNVGDGEGITLDGNHVTLSLNPEKVKAAMTVGMNWSPFRQVNGNWQAYPIDEYWQNAEPKLTDYFTRHPLGGSTATSPEDQANYLKGLVLLARAHYASVYIGKVQLREVKGELLPQSESESMAPDVAGSIEAVIGLTADLYLTFHFEDELQQNITGKGLKDKIVAIVKQFVTDGGDSGLSNKLQLFRKVGHYATAAALGAVLVLSIIGLALGRGGAVVLKAVSSALSLVSLAAEISGFVNVVQNNLKQGLSTLKSLVNGLDDAAKAGAIVGLVIASVVAIGLFIYQWASGGLEVGGVAFNKAFANLLATILVAALLLAISLLVPIGPLVAALLGAIDAVIGLICAVFGLEGWGCDGLLGNLTAWIVSVLYSGTSIVGNLSDAGRVRYFNFAPTIAGGDFAENNTINYSITVSNTIKATDPLGDDATIKDRFWPEHFQNWALQKSTFAYKLQTEKKDWEVELDTMASLWRTAAGTAPSEKGSDQLFLPAQTVVGVSTLGGAGLNRPAQIYLSESYAVPMNDCWYLGVYVSCEIEADLVSNHTDMGKSVKWDVFPATLDGFYAPRDLGDGRYTLAWGQVGETVFPAMKDFDGDGLINRVVGGIDPDDHHFDTDGDGLSDAYEVATNGFNPLLADSDQDGLNDTIEAEYGTDPTKRDSDGDGLSDGEELTGWLMSYTVDGSTVRQTRVWSDPLTADADQDGITDAQERVYGFSPDAANEARVLDYTSTVTEGEGPTMLARFEAQVGLTAFVNSASATVAPVSCTGTCPVVVSSGAVGQAVRFEGNSAPLATTLGTPLNGNRSWTVAFWAQRLAPTTTDMVVVQGTPAAGNNRYLQVGFVGGASSSQFVCGFGGSNQLSGSTTNDSNWHYWACTYDGATRQRVLLRDGVELGRDTAIAPYEGSGQLAVGGELSASTSRFDGLLDEVAVFPTALSVSELQRTQQARYNWDDLVVRPSQPLVYSAQVRNTLFDRYAQGLLGTSAAPNALSNTVAPNTFVLPPQAEMTWNGTLNVNANASGVFSLTQSAGAEVIDWRADSGYARLWLKMDDPAGSRTFADSFGGYPPASATCQSTACPTVVQRDGGNGALNFDGNDLVTVKFGAPFEASAASISTWVQRFDNNLAGSQGILTAGGFSLSLNPSTNPFLPGYYLGCGIGTMSAVSSWPSRNSQWIHVACTYDGQRLVLYQNGVQMASTTGGATSLKTDTFLVGQGGGVSSSFTGQLDDVRLFDRGLSTTDVAALGASNPLKSHLPFDAQTQTATTGPNATCLSGACPTSLSNEGLQGAASFGGQTYVALPSGVLNWAGGQWTQSLWVNPSDSNNTQRQGLMGYQSGERNGAPTIQRVGRKLRFGFGDGSTWRDFETPGDVLTPNTWSHVVATFNGTTYTLYVNGEIVLSTDGLSGRRPSNPSEYWIGRSTNMGRVHLQRFWIGDEGDGAGDAELCMAWQSGPSNSSSAIWQGDVGSSQIGQSIWLNQDLTFTEEGTFRFWEDDSNPKCGGLHTGTDDLELVFRQRKNDG